ncbi:glycosyltransferase [Camelliibacillus cellulosilyticus]|uniref:Glycosyltransferase n=1 Tax=Camelliibacillus cellulosilyticus TaxID=2174486 RepID=A0ABV9GPF3_9BACL
MKVLHLIGGKEIAGSKTHLISLLNQCDRSEVFLCVFDRGEIASEAEALGIKVFYLKQQTRYDFTVLKKLKNLIKGEKINILHTHGPRANVFGYLLSKRMPFIWMTTVHSDPRLDFVGRGLPGWLFTRLHLHVLKSVHHYFAISKRFKEFLIERQVVPEKITTIYNGVNFEDTGGMSKSLKTPKVLKPASEFGVELGEIAIDQKTEKTGERDAALPMGTPPITREDLGFAKNDFIAITVGRLHPIKGHHFLFEAFKNAMLIKPEARLSLIVVGDGALRQKLRDETRRLGIHDRVVFVGHQENVDPYYALADIKILSSISESFPLVVLEAAKAKLPVIATDVGGIKELITGREYGWVIPPMNGKAMCYAIIDALILHEHGRLKAIGENLFHRAANEYSLDRLVNKITETYQNMLTQHSCRK